MKTINIEKIEMLETAVNKVNKFLTVKRRQIELMFPGGFYLKMKKRIRGGEQFLEVHTSGFDGDFPLMDAVEWIAWELIDYRANGILE